MFVFVILCHFSHADAVTDPPDAIHNDNTIMLVLFRSRRRVRLVHLRAVSIYSLRGPNVARGSSAEDSSCCIRVGSLVIYAEQVQEAQ